MFKLLIGVLFLGLVVPSAFAGGSSSQARAAAEPGPPIMHAVKRDIFIKKPDGTLTYKIVLSGHLDKPSTPGAPVKKQFHDVVNIHRVLEVKATLFRVPAKNDPDCGRACGEDWRDKLMSAHAKQVTKRCGSKYRCRYKASNAFLYRIGIAANLQSYADGGPTWSRMSPCTVTMTVHDTETLTRYIYADEAGTLKDPGLVTRKGSQTGSVANEACGKVLDGAYAIYLTVPPHATGYILDLPPYRIPTVTTRGDSPPEAGDFAGATGLPDNTIRLGDRRGGIPLSLPAPGRPYSGKVHIKTLFKTVETPVFNQDRFVPVSADISWQFAPAHSPSIKTDSGH